MITDEEDSWGKDVRKRPKPEKLLVYEEGDILTGRYKDKEADLSYLELPVENDYWEFDMEVLYDLIEKEYTVDEVMREILKDKAFYDNSGGGVTFSGGECMLQIDFLEAILKECKNNGVHAAVDTAGHVPFECFEQIIPYTDLFLYDVKCYDSDKHRQYTGASNELILSNLGRLLKTGIAIWVRIPIIPTVNDSEEEMLNIKKFIISCGSPEKIELLPYHAMGEHKYAAIGKQAQTFSVPSKEKISQLKRVFV
jgi:pyruvate formate lyase activating enzyme